MILVKGSHVAFDLEGGGSVECPARSGMLHDESSEKWPKQSVLVGPYQKTQRPIDARSAGRAYFGGDYQPRAAVLHVPPRALGQWKKVGTVDCIWYVRPGTRANGPFRHGFGTGWVSLSGGAIVVGAGLVGAVLGSMAGASNPPSRSGAILLGVLGGLVVGGIGAYLLLGNAKKPTLYSHGRWYRLELGRGSVVDDRGFVRP